MSISQEDRVLIGNLARENFAMIFCDLDTMTDEQRALYAEIIRTEALKKSPLPEIKKASATISSSDFCMSDEECKKFEKEALHFGKHIGETVDSLMTNDPNYLVWCSENLNSGFGTRVKRYLANPNIARELED